MNRNDILTSDQNGWLRLHQIVSFVLAIFAVIGSVSACAQEAQKESVQLCKSIQKELDFRQVGKQPDKFVLETLNREGNDFEYINVDLDMDKKPDVLLQSCGSPSYGACTLFIDLSSGGKLEFSEDFFFVTRIESEYYILVGESLSETRSSKLNKRRLYLLTSTGTKLICKAI